MMYISPMPPMIKKSVCCNSAKGVPCVSGVMILSMTSVKNTEELMPDAAVIAMHTNTAIILPL